MFYISKKNRNLHAVFEAGCTFASVIDSLIGTDRIFGTMMTSIVAFVYVRNKRACLPVASVEFVTFASIVFISHLGNSGLNDQLQNRNFFFCWPDT